ncbi:MAG: orotidine-5'-phosphate decarboxylase [Candidatus Doudnabacteria bacterium]|nr:orotidine-5'-phosphate decarboxylase [Candidatus Doudnabacteria bacterium]
MPAIDKYNSRVDKVNSLLCVGLDPDFEKLPERFKKLEHPQFEFNKWIIDQTVELVSAFKPNMGAYEARGGAGWRDLQMTMDYLRRNFPDVFTISDAKRGDIGYTNELYARAILDELGFDAVTLHPYLGQEALEPFLSRADKGCIILCRTSNPGASELQDLEFNGQKLWQIVAGRVSKDWNKNQNCMLVVGATYPMELAEVRKITGDMTFLVPGIGTQGGSVSQVMKAGLNSSGKGLVINSSKGIIFSSNPKAEAKKLRDEINQYRNV